MYMIRDGKKVRIRQSGVHTPYGLENDVIAKTKAHLTRVKMNLKDHNDPEENFYLDDPHDHETWKMFLETMLEIHEN